MLKTRVVWDMKPVEKNKEWRLVEHKILLRLEMMRNFLCSLFNSLLDQNAEFGYVIFGRILLLSLPMGPKYLTT